MPKCLLILLLSLSIKTFSQTPDNTAWCPPGATWVYKILSAFNHSFLELSYIKDTTILGKTARQLQSRSIKFFGPQNQIRSVTVIGYDYFYNSNDSIYFLDTTEFKFIYNFNPQVNDEWITGTSRNYNCTVPDFPIQDTFIVNSVSSLTLGSKIYNQINISSDSQNFYMGNIIKNIGPSIAPYPVLRRSKCNSFTDADIGSFEGLICYSDNIRGVVPFTNNSGFSCGSIITFLTNILNQEEVFSVFPNPVKDFLFLKNIAQGKFFYSVNDAWGRIVLSGKLNNAKINVSVLQPGAYFISLKSISATFSKRFIKH